MKNEIIQNKYLRIARLSAFILQLTPFVRMIGLNGSLARNKASSDSDIDFLIITQPGHIWTCRFLSMALMFVSGLKRYKNRVAGRVCLNLYQTEDHLKLTCHNQYLATNYAHTLPLWQANGLFSKFMASNPWIEKYGESFYYKNYKSNLFERILSAVFLLIRSVLEIILTVVSIGGWIEKLLKKYQINRIKKDPRTLKSKDGEIFITDCELRFHPNKD